MKSQGVLLKLSKKLGQTINYFLSLTQQTA